MIQVEQMPQEECPAVEVEPEEEDDDDHDDDDEEDVDSSLLETEEEEAETTSTSSSSSSHQNASSSLQVKGPSEELEEDLAMAARLMSNLSNHLRYPSYTHFVAFPNKPLFPEWKSVGYTNDDVLCNSHYGCEDYVHPGNRAYDRLLQHYGYDFRNAGTDAAEKLRVCLQVLRGVKGRFLYRSSKDARWKTAHREAILWKIRVDLKHPGNAKKAPLGKFLAPPKKQRTTDPRGTSTYRPYQSASKKTLMAMTPPATTASNKRPVSPTLNDDDDIVVQPSKKTKTSSLPSVMTYPSLHQSNKGAALALTRLRQVTPPAVEQRRPESLSTTPTPPTLTKSGRVVKNNPKYDKAATDSPTRVSPPPAPRNVPIEPKVSPPARNAPVEPKEDKEEEEESPVVPLDEPQVTNDDDEKDSAASPDKVEETASVSESKSTGTTITTESPPNSKPKAQAGAANTTTESPPNSKPMAKFPTTTTTESPPNSKPEAKIQTPAATTKSNGSPPNGKSKAKFQTPEERWSEYYHLLKVFRQEHGHVNVPSAQSKEGGEHGKLYMWLAKQRERYRAMPGVQVCEYRKSRSKKVNTAKPLTREECNQLMALGVDLTSSRLERLWNERFNELVEFQKKFGHTQVPRQRGGKYQKLYDWMGKQQHRYRAWLNPTASRRTPLTKMEYERLGKVGVRFYP